MAATAGPNLGLTYGYEPGDSGWGVDGYNPGFNMLDALVFLSVIDHTLSAPPGSPAEGDRYIVAAGGSGDWSGHSQHVARFRGSAWEFFVPAEGWKAYSLDLETDLKFNGSIWVTAGGGAGGYSNAGSWSGIAAYSAGDVVQHAPDADTRAFLCWSAVEAPEGADAPQEWDDTSGSGNATFDTNHTTNDRVTWTGSANIPGTIGKLDGKWYIEFEKHSFSGNNDGWGASWQDVSANVYGRQIGTIVGTTGVGSGSWPGASNDSQRVALAVDLDAKLFWITPNAADSPVNWNGSTSNDPATGTGGVSMGSTLVDGVNQIYPFATSGASGRTCTMYTLPDDFVGAAPDGFNAWVGGSPNPEPQNDPDHWIGPPS